jgi:hypothetical protein
VGAWGAIEVEERAMMRLLRTLTILGVIAGIPAAGWALVRRFNRTSAMPDDPRPLGYGSDFRRMVHRAGRVLRGDFQDDPLGDGRTRAAIPFDWSFGSTDAGIVGTALATEGIPVDVSGVVPEGRDLLLTDKLTAAGIHLDQEPNPAMSAVPRSRFTGNAQPEPLMRAVERALDTVHSGIIVDTTRGATVEIDEHQNVGKGNVVLIDATGSRVLRHGTTRLLLQALQDVSDHHSPVRRPGAPDVPRNISIA